MPLLYGLKLSPHKFRTFACALTQAHMRRNDMNYKSEFTCDDMRRRLVEVRAWLRTHASCMLRYTDALSLTLPPILPPPLPLFTPPLSPPLHPPLRPSIHFSSLVSVCNSDRVYSHHNNVHHSVNARVRACTLRVACSELFSETLNLLVYFITTRVNSVCST